MKTAKEIKEELARSRLIIERYKPPPPPASGKQASRVGEQRELPFEEKS